MKIDNTAPLLIDAINMLIMDHCEVEECFQVLTRTSEDKPEARKAIVSQICHALYLHMAVEEEIFYPAVREVLIELRDEIWQGVIDHDKARILMEQLEAMDGDDELFTARVGQLAAIVSAHVKEEESEIFPKVINSSIDSADLCKKMLKRKAELCHAAEAKEPADAGAVSS